MLGTSRVLNMSEEAYQKVNDLRPSLRSLNLIVRVVNLGEPREVHSKRNGSEHKVAEAMVGDETGSILLTLWGDQIGHFAPEDVVEIKNGYTSLFRGSLRLNIGRYGTAEKVDKEVGEVNTENNLSEKQYQTQPWRSPSRRPFYRRRRKY